MSRVGILATSRPGFGGTFQYTLSMIEALRLLPENEYTIFTVRGNGSYDDLGLPIERLPMPPSAIISAAACRAGLGGRWGLFQKMDKIVAPIYSTYLLASAVPFAFTLHDLQEKYYPEYFTVAQRIWRQMSNGLLTRTASRIVCESMFVKRDIERFFSVQPDRIAVMPAPPLSLLAETQADESVLAAVRLKYNLPAQFVFYPSQFFPHKNHLRLVEAFVEIRHRHPNCSLVLTGQKKYEYARVIARVQELGLAATVLHLGYLEPQDLAAIYRLATLIVIPTLFESISIPVYEAFLLGTPVCASNVVALPEQIGDAGVLFDPFSINDTTEKISTTLADGAFRRELVRRGSERIAAMTQVRYSLQLKALLDQIN